MVQQAEKACDKELPVRRQVWKKTADHRFLTIHCSDMIDGEGLIGSRRLNLLYYWMPVLAYCLFIFILSSKPAPEQVPVFPFSDKVIHFLIYAPLGVLFYRAFGTLKSRIWVTIILSVSVSALYGASDEIHQAFVPSRTAELSDVLADALGSLFGVILFYVAVGKKRDRKRK